MTFRRHTDKPDLDPSAVRSLPSAHPAMTESRTLFPSTVVEVTATAPDRLLVSGKNNRKLGERVAKGKFKGYAIYQLSLEERATCPAYCEARGFCFGNGMQMARRHKIGDPDVFYTRLEAEIIDLLARHGSLLIRLHVLGDFPSVEYVAFWGDILNTYQNVACFGYTHRRSKSWNGDEIGEAIQSLKDQHPDRFRIRWSSSISRPDGSVIVDFVPPRARIDQGLVCPAQTDATACCASCALCWEPAAKNDCIVFIKHGPRSADAAAEKAAERTFEEQVLGTRKWLTGFAINLCRDETLAEDLVQETYIRALANRDKFDGFNLSAWLTTILKNHFFSLRRKRKREVEDVDGAFSDTLVAQDNPEIDAMTRDEIEAFENLDPEKREMLREIASGDKYEDVAERHGVAVGTVKSRVHRGREELRVALSETPRPRKVAQKVAEIAGTTDVRSIAPIDLPSSLKPASVEDVSLELRMVRPADLLVEGIYQRSLSGKSIKLIRKIVAGWDWAKVKPPIVAETDAGLFVIDGQHTAIAAASHPGIKKIPVFLVDVPDLQSRAESFVSHNRDRLAMTPAQVFYGECAAGLKESNEILKAVMRSGGSIPKGGVGKKSAQAGQVAAVGELRAIYRAHGAAGLERAIAILIAAGQAPIAKTGLRALSMIFAEQRYAGLAALDNGSLAKAVAAVGDLEVQSAKLAADTGQSRFRAAVLLIAAAAGIKQREEA